MELRHLRYFLAVAEQLNFSRAAAVLGTAQPSLSQQIRQLEREIGTELFVRGKRQIVLTAAGRELVVEAREIVARVGAVAEHAREAARGLRGELRLAYTVSGMMTILPDVIRAYRADHPDVRVTLRAAGITEILTDVRDGRTDAGVLLMAEPLRQTANVELRPLGSVPIAVMLGARHPAAARPAIALDQIGAAPLIVYRRHLTEIYDVAVALCRERGFTPARIEQVDRLETILGLVAAGEGVSIVPRVYELLRFPGVTYSELTPHAAPFTVVVARNSTRNTELTSAFARICERVAAGGER